MPWNSETVSKISLSLIKKISNWWLVFQYTVKSWLMNLSFTLSHGQIPTHNSVLWFRSKMSPKVSYTYWWGFGMWLGYGDYTWLAVRRWVTGGSSLCIFRFLNAIPQATFLCSAPLSCCSGLETASSGLKPLHTVTKIILFSLGANVRYFVPVMRKVTNIFSIPLWIQNVWI